MPRKSGTSGSERGRRKRTRSTGTSSAAYSTASPVREETDGKGPGQGHLAGGRPHLKRGMGKPGQPTATAPLTTNGPGSGRLGGRPRGEPGSPVH